MMQKVILLIVATGLVAGCKHNPKDPSHLTKTEVREVQQIRETTQDRVDSTLKPKLASVDHKVSGIQREVSDVEDAVKVLELSAMKAIQNGIEANSEDAAMLKRQTEDIMSESSMLRGQVGGLETSVRDLSDTITKLGQELVTAHEEIAKLNIRISKEYELRMIEIEKKQKAEAKVDQVKRQRNTLALVGLGSILILGGLIYLTNKRSVV